MTADDDWVKAAMADDAIVVHLLVTIHNTPPPLPHHALPLHWTVRQRRSKSISLSSKTPPPHRARARGSPTTALSWSAAVNSEDSTPSTARKFSPTARSKANIDTEKKASRRSKKKTLLELKQEAISLTKERRELKRELATLRKNLEMQRATNKKLKSMKIELQPRLRSTSLRESISGPKSSLCYEDTILESSTSYAKMVLPDLNIPFDEPNLC